jgi:hypothetical protein
MGTALALFGCSESDVKVESNAKAASGTDLPPTSAKNEDHWMPEQGVVPDTLTAAKIAEAVWLPLYGKDVLSQKPYVAELVGDSLWIVNGTLEEYMFGGTAYIEIRKSDGKILKVTHYE